MTEEHSVALSLVSKVVLVVLASLVFVVGVVANAFTCHVVLRKPSMRSAVNLLLSTVALSDLLLVALCLPFNVASLFTDGWPLSKTLCKYHAFFHSVFLVENAAVLAAISIDHYLIIVHHHERLTSAHARLVIFFTWALSVSFSLPGLLRDRGFVMTSGYTQCELAPAESPAEKMYMGLRFCVTFLAPLTVIGFTFVCIVNSVRNNWLRIGCYPPLKANYKSSAQRYIVAVPRRPHYFLDDMRFKTRTFSTVSILFVAFIVGRAPYAIGILVTNLAQCTSVSLHTYLLWWNFLTPALNPVIYAWRIRKLREAYGRWFPRLFAQMFPFSPTPKVKPYTISSGRHHHHLNGYYNSIHFGNSVV